LGCQEKNIVGPPGCLIWGGDTKRGGALKGFLAHQRSGKRFFSPGGGGKKKSFFWEGKRESKIRRVIRFEKQRRFHRKEEEKDVA